MRERDIKERRRLTESYKKDLKEIKKDHKETLTEEIKRFEETVNNEKQKIDENFKMVKEVGEKNIEEMLVENSQKIDKYEKKAHDPFYKMVLPELKLIENNTHYVASAKVPEYEKEKVFITVQNGLLRLSGSRANEIRLIDNDKDIISNNYNTFIETKELKKAVDLKGIEREYSDGVLKVTIPKVV